MTKFDKSRTVFLCQRCGKESLKWLGRCPECQEWNTLVETTVAVVTPARATATPMSAPQELSRISTTTTDRMPLPMTEFNRVLGGGLVAGSLVLISGDPGIGKSTLLLQVSAVIAKLRGSAVYVSGEETEHQIKLRAERLGIKGDKLFLLAETDLDAILCQLDTLAPGMVVIDSIQSVGVPELGNTSGNVAQIRECAQRLMHWAKQHAVPVFISGHVTKEGAIAGPKLLEHMVDAVLYFEGAPFSSYRLLRCVKNRFGSTNEVAVFEMGEKGLVEVENPSEAFLSERGEEAIGSSVVPVLEGNRPLLVEIQALTTPTIFGMPRRTANGVDYNRLLLIIAVLTKRAGLKLGNQDIIVNVAGGLRIEEPAADLGIALSIASSFRNAGVKPGLAAMGEVGLSGELRSVPQLDRRLKEVARLGFKYCLVPRVKAKSTSQAPKEIQLIQVNTVREAVGLGLMRSKATEQEDDIFES